MRFIDAFPEMKEHGAVSRLAEALGITPSAISQWSRVPAERLPAVASATGIPADKLRPDIFRVARSRSARKREAA